MDIVTQKIIEIAKEFHDVVVTEEEIKNGKSFQEYGIDSIDTIEFMLNLEDAFGDNLTIPDFDNADVSNMYTLWKYVSKNLPEAYK